MPAQEATPRRGGLADRPRSAAQGAGTGPGGRGGGKVRSYGRGRGLGAGIGYGEWMGGMGGGNDCGDVLTQR